MIYWLSTIDYRGLFIAEEEKEVSALTGEYFILDAMSISNTEILGNKLFIFLFNRTKKLMNYVV